MGPERCLLAFYDEPDLVREMISCFSASALWIAEYVTRDVSVDYALFLEDMSYKNGPMFSPDFFHEFLSPHYRAITEVLQSRGVDLIFVDTDGSVDRLVPLFLEVGINGCLPMEVAAGNDPIRISDAFHRRMRMMGGIDKRAIAAGKHAVEVQFNALVPAMAQRGGFIPHVDHAVASDLPFQHYCHYRRLLGEMSLA
jgi:uroporphyrinogen decarboxylase